MSDEAKNPGSIRIAAVQLSYFPNRISARGQHWFPAEPLFGLNPFAEASDWSNDASISRLADAPESSLAFLGEELSNLNRSNYRRKVQQILEFVRDREVDIVCFPEYSLPPDFLPLIKGYARDLHVVAGLGFVRADEEEHFREVGLEPPSIGMNVAVMLGPDGATLVTKRHGAEGERIEKGRGTEIAEIDVGGRKVEVGLAICLDYIHAGHTFESQSDLLDIAVIPALSADTTEFHPHKSRDFVRVVANHAAAGGTSIYLPHPQGAFVNAEGTDPLPPGAEGVLVVDFDRLPTRRTSTTATQNALVYRASIVYQDAMGGEAEVATRLAQLNLDAQNAGERDGQVTSWIDELSSHDSTDSLLVESIREMRAVARRKLLDTQSLRLFQTHLILNEVQTDAEIRYAQVRAVLERLRADVKEGRRNLGIALEHYGELEASLSNRVRPKLLTSARKRKGGTHGPEETLFALNLGPFNTDDALRTLPRQLSLLRAFADLRATDTALIYRLSTRPLLEEEGRMRAHFEVICAVRGARPEFVEDLRKDLHDQMRVTFVDGWSVSASGASPELQHSWIVELVPGLVDGCQPIPEIREDWSPLVDQLRRNDTAMAIQLTLNYVGALEDVDWHEHPAGDDEASGLIAPSDRQAAAFFRRVAAQSAAAKRELGLRIHVAGDDEHGEWLPYAIGREVLGNLAFRVERREESPEVFPSPTSFEQEPHRLVLRADEALRIFHPPFGHIQSRGISGRRATELALDEVELPESGLTLGNATRQTSREDESIEIKIDTEARLRHLYIVGKTGSGKTNLLKHLVRQDVKAGRGLAVLDPHGDLVDYALGHAEGRLSDVVLLDFGRVDALPVLNPLLMDVDDAAELDLAIEELVEIVIQRVSSDYTGPVFEDTMRLALESITHPRLTSIVPPSLLYTGVFLNSEPGRRWIQKKLSGTELGDRWKTFNNMNSQNLAEHVRWVTAKFAEMSKEGVLRSVLGGAEPSVSIRDAVCDGKVLLVRLPEATIGPRAASFIGSLIFSRIRRTMFDSDRRAGQENGPEPFFLYVDEFQKFVGGGFDQLVAEARKFGLGLTIAHQNLRQLEAYSKYERRTTDSLLETLLGNVGNIVTMRTARRDGKQLASELDVESSDVAGIAQFDALARIVVNHEETPAFTLRNGDANANLGFPATRDAVRSQMIKEGMWVDRDELEDGYEEAVRLLESKWVESRKTHPERPSTSSPLPDLKGLSVPWEDQFAFLKDIRGIEPAQASKIKEAFPRLEDLLDAGPERLAEVDGISPRLARRIVKAGRRAAEDES